MSLNLRKHFVLTMVAAPRMGKSHLINYLIYDLCVVKKMFNGVVVFTGSPHYYYGLIPEKFIHETYNDNKMRQIEQHQKSHPESELLIIFDDFRGMIKNFHDQNSVLSSILTRYRHPNTHFSCIFACHLSNHISPTVRTITTYWVVFRQKDKNSAKLLYECAGYEFESYDDFKKYIDTHCVDKSFLFVDKEAEENATQFARAPAVIPKYSLNY
jgi:hypothetical protein